MSDAPDDSAVVPKAPRLDWPKVRSFLFAPAPAAKADEPIASSVWDTLLSWPIRLGLIALAFTVGVIWHTSPLGIQLGHGLQYGLLLAVSIVASCWLYVAIPNLFVSVTWLAWSWKHPGDVDARPARWGFADYVSWANHEVGNVEALATWIALVLVWTTSLLWQLVGLACIALLGSKAIGWIAQWGWFQREETAADFSARLHIRRRPITYAVTVLGLILLVLCAPAQWRTTVPLWLTLLPGLVVRLLRAWRRHSLERGKLAFSKHRLHRASFQQPYTGWIGPALLVSAFVGISALSVWQRQQWQSAARSEFDGPPPPPYQCAAEPGGPRQGASSISVFLIADTQVNELGGGRFSGQMSIADAIMPVARRPVELDMLASASVRHLGNVYLQLFSAELRPNPPLWAHLGDFSNISCAYEMERALALLRPYHSFADPHATAAGAVTTRRLLAGLASGNHDMSFHGNFDWNPNWDKACVVDDRPSAAGDGPAIPLTPPQRMDKAVMDPLLARLAEDPAIAVGASTVIRGMDWTRLSPNRPLARYTLSRLGILSPARGKRGVLGLFIDTSDRGDRNFGIAGLVGAFSWRQAREIASQVSQMKQDARKAPADSAEAAWVDPWIVVFGHSPYRELRSSSALDWLMAELDSPSDACQLGGDECYRPRILAMLAAHTHTAASHRHCINRRLIREIIIGSTLDPPQEAALLEIGLDAREHAALRVSTIPAVERPGFVCSSRHDLSAVKCHAIVGDLYRDPACTDLVQEVDTRPSSSLSCEELERPLSLQEKIRGIALFGGPDEATEIKKVEEQRARALLRCLCRGPQRPAACDAAYADPLTDAKFTPVIDQLAADPARHDELTCLSWAASAVQRHKANGMTMANALRCAFDDPTLQPAQVTTTNTEVVPCY